LGIRRDVVTVTLSLQRTGKVDPVWKRLGKPRLSDAPVIAIQFKSPLTAQIH
jgi:hypothetical protein